MAGLKNMLSGADFIVAALKGPLSTAPVSVPWSVFPVSRAALWHHTRITFQLSCGSVPRISSPLKRGIWIRRCGARGTEEGENLREAGRGELVLRALRQSRSTSTFQVKYSGRVSWVLRSVCGPITSAKKCTQRDYLCPLKIAFSSCCNPCQTYMLYS